MKKLLLMMTLLLVVVPLQAAGMGGIFGQGRTQFSVMAGNAYAFNNNYMVIGASASYYVIDGLGVGLSLENWSGGNPAITKVSPFVQYVFQGYSMQPYVGAFYRHASIAGLPSLDSIGGRAGVYIPAGRNSSVGIGLAHESYMRCNEEIYLSCRSTYSEVSIIFGF